jgi:Tol biopolymer transport system component
VKKQQITLLILLACAAAITVGCGDSHPPTFNKLPFVSNRTVDPSTPLFLMNLDGSNVTPVAYSLNGIYSPSISADFKTVAFTSGSEVWVSNADGTSQTQLTDNNASGFYSYFAKISPDGKKIVYGNWDGATYKFWIMNSDGTGNLNLTSTLPANMEGCHSGSFSADSKQIVFACYNFTTYTFGLYLIRPDGTHLSTVATQDAFLDTPMFSPNGKQILFASFGGAANAAHKSGSHLARAGARRQAVHANVTSLQGIVSINLDGSNATVVVPDGWEAEILNSTLYYTLYNSDLGLDQIYKSNLDGTGSAAISDGTADDWLGLSSD